MQATKANVRVALITFDQQFRETTEWQGWETRANQLYALKWKGKLYPVLRGRFPLDAPSPTSRRYGSAAAIAFAGNTLKVKLRVHNFDLLQIILAHICALVGRNGLLKIKMTCNR